MAGWICSREFLVTQIVLLLQKTTDGFRFNPTEQQLINHLKSKEPGRREGFCIIPTLENITDFNPKDLPAKFTEKSIIPSNDREWWFICPQTQNQRVRVRRKTPCGSSWGITGQPRDITIGGKKIGFKKILSFPEGKAKKDWIIHEYHLPQDLPNSSGNNVLCHLMRKQDEKNDNSTTRSEDGTITQAEVEQWYNQFNDEPMVQEGISPTLYTFSLPHLLQLLQHGLQLLNDSSSSTIHQFTKIQSLSDADLSYAKGKKVDEPRFEMVQQENGARTIEDEAAGRAKLLPCGLQSPNNSSSSTIHHFTNVGNSSDFSYAKVQKGEEPRFEKVQQETAARNIKDEAAGRAKLPQHGLQSPNNSSSLRTTEEDEWVDAMPDADLSCAKVQRGEEPKFEMVQQETGAKNIEDEAAAEAKLLPRGLQSPNNGSSSTIHHFTNVGNSSDVDFSYAKVQKGEEPRFEKVQQETAARNIKDEAAGRAKLPQHGLQSPNNSSSLRTTEEDEWVDAMPDADLSCAKVQKGEEPKFEMVQQETGARNIEDEAAGRAKLLQHGLQSPNNSSSSTKHQFTNIRSLSDADLSDAKGKKGEEPRFEMVQQENGARNIEDEAAGRAKLLQRGLQLPNNSSSSTIHQFTNIRSLSVPNADLFNAEVQNGEEPDKSVELESSHGRTECDDWAASLIIENPSDTEVQRGEEPRLEKDHQETAATSTEPCITSDEDAVRAKNGQIFITENRRSKVEPLNCVFPPEETEGFPSSPFRSSGFLDFSEFGDFFHQPADQEKGLEHEQHNLGGNSSKRRRVDVSEENQIQ